MKFHKEGYPTLLVTILFSTIIISIAKLIFPEFAIAHWFAGLREKDPADAQVARRMDKIIGAAEGNAESQIDHGA